MHSWVRFSHSTFRSLIHTGRQTNAKNENGFQLWILLTEKMCNNSDIFDVFHPGIIFPSHSLVPPYVDFGEIFFRTHSHSCDCYINITELDSFSLPNMLKWCFSREKQSIEVNFPNSYKICR